MPGFYAHAIIVSMEKSSDTTSEAGTDRLQKPLVVASGDLPNAVSAQRLAARQSQSLVEKDQLIKHLQLSLDLFLMDDRERDQALAAAQKEVERWQNKRLCSGDFIQSWDRLLGLPIDQLVRAMTSLDREAAALRQNSPSIFVPRGGSIIGGRTP